ncbi:protein UXT [Stegostoma tigrinum]|uniref:protein UXT n=1 Tax=Stegostoma tigrinum TaxID=3053191 RepID=UPI002870458D|nr:protein UXT [Stegostoma tigrinum]
MAEGAGRKVLEYEAFVNDVLKRDLKKVLEQRDEIYEKIAQHLQLKNVIERLQESDSEGLKMEVDLGCNFYLQAKVPDASMIFVSIGYGFFVELTFSEALRFLEKKTQHLNELAGRLSKDSAKIKSNIRMVLEALCELQGFRDLPETENGREIF